MNVVVGPFARFLTDECETSDKVNVRRDHHGLYIQFEWHNNTSEWMPDFWSYNIFIDRRETWRCNGFTTYTAEKQYYGKQFMNMIHSKQHYHALEQAKKKQVIHPNVLSIV